MANETYQLVVRKGPRPGQVIPLDLDTLSVGRDPLSDIIMDDPEVSRHHARITYSDVGYQLQDMGSTNGTFVDGKRLGGEAVTLKPGQVIMFGSNVTLIYQALSESDPMATMVAPAMPGLETPEESVEPEPVPEVEEPALPAFEEPEPLPSFEEPAAEAPEIQWEEDDLEMATMMEPGPFGAEPPEPSPEPPPEKTAPPVFEEPSPIPSFDELMGEPEPKPTPAFEEPPPAPAPMFDMAGGQAGFDSGQPLPDVPGEPVPAPAPSAPVEDKKDNQTRNIIIGVVALLLVCCCVLAIVFGVLFATGTI